MRKHSLQHYNYLTYDIVAFHAQTQDIRQAVNKTHEFVNPIWCKSHMSERSMLRKITSLIKIISNYTVVLICDDYINSVTFKQSLNLNRTPKLPLVLRHFLLVI